MYATIFIDSTSTQDIFIQRLYWFNFDTGYFVNFNAQSYVLWNEYIYSTSTKKNIFIQQNIFIQFFKFPEIDKFLFNKAPPPYPPAAPSLKT